MALAELPVSLQRFTFNNPWKSACRAGRCCSNKISWKVLQQHNFRDKISCQILAYECMHAPHAPETVSAWGVGSGTEEEHAAAYGQHLALPHPVRSSLFRAGSRNATTGVK